MTMLLNDPREQAGSSAFIGPSPRTVSGAAEPVQDRTGRRCEELSGAMSPGLKKFLIFGVVALVLFLLISKPTESAEAVQTALSWLGDGAQALVTFVERLFS
ncbi:hypothetical protein FHS23_002303 [Prauserella isguenensis]|uniref:Uncharacterized protein n=2 Tax=Prauserella TaxID=142577 RepID=A0A839S2J3_9PSEU|nr:hypothetical protein [Prauserella isguenensis]MBB3051280.1 hypothetical protein [Prauserella isguenensis]